MARAIWSGDQQNLIWPHGEDGIVARFAFGRADVTKKVLADGL
jgi:hypothetical protein